MARQQPRSIFADQRVHPSVAWIAFSLFFLSILFSIAFVRMSIATVPIRSLLAVASVGVLAVANPSLVFESILRARRFLLVIVLFAALGAIVSFINANPTPIVLRQLIEIHFQAAIGVVITVTLAAAVGTVPIVWSFLIALSITAAVAIFQLLGVEHAWELRASAGALMHETRLTQLAYERQERVLGLSYSSVHLATQTCLGFAAYFLIRTLQGGTKVVERLDWRICAAGFIAMVICTISGNRSPLLGFVAFFLIYFVVVAPRLTVIISPLMVGAAIVGWLALDQLAAMGFRVASTEDGSAVGRAVLALYGVRLFLEHPIGYGLTFDSTKHASRYFHDFIGMGNSQAIRNYALHNYPLLILNKYGAAVIALVALVFPRRRQHWLIVLAFLPYILHILFHNDGPFQADFLIWYILPLFPSLLESAPDQVSRPRTWTRTYKAQQAAAQQALRPEAH